MYGSLPAAEAASQRPARRTRPLLGSALVAVLALAVVCVVYTVDRSGRVVLESDNLISAAQAGLLGRVGQNTENTIGDLATVAHSQQHAAHTKKHPIDHVQTGNMHDALVYRQKALQLLQAKKRLQEQEKKIDAMTKAETAAYVKAVQQAKSTQKHHAAAAHPQTAEMAKQVASMVLDTIEPQLNAQREEIARLSAETQGKQQPAAEGAAKPEVKEHYPPAFPAHFSHPAPVHAEHAAKAKPVPASKKPQSFQDALSKFLGETGVMKRVHGHQKAMTDYRMDNGGEDPGQGAEPEGEEEAEWTHPEAKGSPCSVSGKCNHGRTDQIQGPEYWAAHRAERWNDDDEGEEGEEGEEGDEGDEVHLGNEVVMRSLDDFVAPQNAYIHNLLTSGAYGIDHFGHLAPMSRENQILMYGAGMPADRERLLGKELNTPGKGGAHTDEVDERRSPLGEDRIGDDDVEIPTALSKPPFPTEDYDHFDHWAHDSPENQELLNGIYWRRLKKDGFMDRIMDTDEAHSHLIGDGHDRKPLPDMAFGSWHQGFGYGPTKEHPSPFVRAREETHGEEWQKHVFTGTHENVEEGKGVVKNMEHDGALFKHSPAAPAPTLHASHHPVLHRTH